MLVNEQSLLSWKLVSNNDIRTCIEEVLSSVPIESKTIFNRVPVKWEHCVTPYAVDESAFMCHTRGRNKGVPLTVGERMAISRAKGKVTRIIKSVGSLEQQRLILL